MDALCALIRSFGAHARQFSFQALLAGVLLPPAAMATEVVPWSLAETVRQADAIVLGTVTSRQSRWVDASRRWIETDYTFSIEEIIHADPESGAFG